MPLSHIKDIDKSRNIAYVFVLLNGKNEVEGRRWKVFRSECTFAYTMPFCLEKVFHIFGSWVIYFCMIYKRSHRTTVEPRTQELNWIRGGDCLLSPVAWLVLYLFRVCKLYNAPWWWGYVNFNQYDDLWGIDRENYLYLYDTFLKVCCNLYCRHRLAG